MQVASLENSKRLYELSLWADTQNYWKSIINHNADKWSDFKVVDFNGAEIPEAFGERTYPAYDLGFMLRKLPDYVKLFRNNKGTWFVAAVTDSFRHPEDQLGEPDTAHEWITDNSPEDAACLLLIKLLEEGVLSTNNSHEDS